MAESAALRAVDDAYAYCEARLKEGDRTMWLASLFAPANQRPALHALGAFVLEVSGVRAKVREPLAGELRLQWWSDAIEGEARGDVRGHPIAAALIDTIRRCQLPRIALTALIDAKRDDLYDDALSTVDDFFRRADQVEGAQIQLRAQILAGPIDSATEQAARHAGRALAILQTFRDLSGGASPMPMTVPLDLLKAHGIGAAEVRVQHNLGPITAALADLRRLAETELTALRGLRTSIVPDAAAAFLLSSLMHPMLRRTTARGFNPFTTRIDLPQWRRQWLLWRASGRNGVL